MLLHRQKPVTGNETALRDLNIANGLVRRGRRVEAERKFRAILISLRSSRTPEDTQAKVISAASKTSLELIFIGRRVIVEYLAVLATCGN